MKIVKILTGFLITLPFISCSQVDFHKIGKDIEETVNTGKPLTSQEITDGLKEALNTGSRNAGSKASKPDGYFKNSLIKIVFPPEAAAMESKLRSIGMGKQVDEFILTMNRAAEEAAAKAAPVFLNAIKNMTITDGINILNGSDTAATSYLRQKTSAGLTVQFKPVIHDAVQKVSVTRYWSPLITAYNNIPFVNKLNPDIESYINDRALHGLFILVGQEESNIRRNPAARVTALLKKVFGSRQG
ncbi:MAG: DUF4197 domain-containing protein [Bacteroidia bacterium]|nr:DUF4197 domain-containing protein [Bacteroidia bacterium]